MVFISERLVKDILSCKMIGDRTFEMIVPAAFVEYT